MSALPLIRTPRTIARGARPPSWPFALNADSIQAQNLRLWVPAIGMLSSRDLSRQQHACFSNTVPNYPVGGRMAHVFNGSSSRIEPTSVDEFNFAALTVTAMINKATPTGYQALIGRQGGYDPSSYGWLLQTFDTNGYPFLKVQTNTGSQQGYASVNICDGKWHHVVGTVNDTSKVWTVFVDGLKYPQTNFTGSFVDTGGVLRIGGEIVYGGSYFNGALDDVRLYDAVISDHVVNQIWETPYDLYYELGRRSFFFPVVDAALTETLVPTSDVATAVNATGTFADVDEGVATADGTTFIAPTNTSLGMTKPLAYGPLTAGRSMVAGAGLQKVRVKAWKIAGAGTPTLTVQIREVGGSVLATPINAVAVTNEAGEVIEGTFDATVITDKTAEDIETVVITAPGGS